MDILKEVDMFMGGVLGDVAHFLGIVNGNIKDKLLYTAVINTLKASTDLNYPQLAKIFQRNHTTLMYHIRKHDTFTRFGHNEYNQAYVKIFSNLMAAASVLDSPIKHLLKEKIMHKQRQVKTDFVNPGKTSYNEQVSTLTKARLNRIIYLLEVGRDKETIMTSCFITRPMLNIINQNKDRIKLNNYKYDKI